MCGIAGWVDFDHDAVPERALLERMTGTMACRGPDDQGLWLDHHVALGHRRLAIIDLDGGRQPMQAGTDGSGPAVVLTYSGEVYNFKELRATLRDRGHRF
ncbi:MAG: hypothetical protein QOD57_4084, partial [Actinomycetota bacterium]|nr:hypothetical protein [Actinomycetota bacterium]